MVSHTLIGFFSFLIICVSCCNCRNLQDVKNGLTLELVRDFLTRQEDSIVFGLIERARFPLNSPAYDSLHLGSGAVVGCRNGSIAEFVIQGTEAIQAKAGQYQNPEEVPFFPHNLQWPLVPPYNYPKILLPAAASVNVSSTIWNVYFHSLLPLLTAKGDDGNYALTAAADHVSLQALSRRIHYGRFVAEVKFKGAPKDYIPFIRAQDKDGLMKLVTNESQEDAVKRRVVKKAMVFGQDVTLENDDKANNGSSPAKYKVDPSAVYRLYDEWVIPLTKLVEVEYLLRRLD